MALMYTILYSAPRAPPVRRNGASRRRRMPEWAHLELRMERLTRNYWTSARHVAAAMGMLAGGLALGTVGAGYYAVRALTAPNKPRPDGEFTITPFETGVTFEDVRFPAEGMDHLVSGWWLVRPETSRVIIGCTGYRARKSDLIGISSALWRAGFNVLLFDYHGHGDALGQRVTLAHREMSDFFGALDYALQRVPEARIGVLGYSMGASIAIMGAARRPEIRAVVADSPFATHADVFSYRIAQTLRVPATPVASVANRMLPYVAGYHAEDVAPLHEIVEIAPRPILLIHGCDDTAIPVAHTRRLYDAAGEPKALWLVEGAEHCGAYFMDRPAYCDRIAQFFEYGLCGDPREASREP